MELPYLPLGGWIERAIEFLTDNFDAFFEAINTILEIPIEALESLLLWPPSFVIVLLVGLLCWRLRGIRFAVAAALGLLLIDSMRMWEPAMETLALVVVATLVAGLIGIPIGILAARNQMASTVIRPILDFMQTLPVFVYLLPAVFFFGIGVVPGAVATVIFAIPPGVRLTELGLRQIDKEVIEAGQAFGSTDRQLLRKVELPLALPTIMAGINQVIMLALSMVVVAGMIGAGGLGGEVIRSITRLNIALGFESGISVVILAVLLDRITESLGKRAQRHQHAGE